MPEAKRPSVQALVYGVLRHYERLNAIAALLLKKPFKKKDQDVHLLLLIGLFELQDQRTASHAVVNEIVNQVKSRWRWAAGLVNACLRRYQREQSDLDQQALEDKQAQYGLPSWWLEALESAWPDELENISAQFSSPPPMTLRVNLAKVSREVYQAQLQELGLQSTVHTEVPSALTLSTPVDVEALPGFVDGLVSVQDAAAQLAAWLMQPERGERLLDACAAPGGKMAHILEQVDGQCDLTAIEFDARRAEKLGDTLARLGFDARICVADAGDPRAWWDGQEYDRILLDAPCSATGTVRRNPDVKRHRQSSDIPALAAQQRRLLDELWETLRPGGMLVYATCSILPQENEQQMVDFLARHDDAVTVDIEANWGHALGAGRQILPGEHDMDGFYYARVTKR